VRASSSIPRIAVSLALLLVWILFWVVTALIMHAGFSGYSELARGIGSDARLAGEAMTANAQGLGVVPWIGGSLSQPFIDLASGLTALGLSADTLAGLIDGTATGMAATLIVVPAIIGIVVWARWFVRTTRRARVLKQFVARGGGVDLFALQALATLPVEDLAAISADPVAAWRVGDVNVIHALAGRYLERNGLEWGDPAEAAPATTGFPPAAAPFSSSPAAVPPAGRASFAGSQPAPEAMVPPTPAPPGATPLAQAAPRADFAQPPQGG
jgi:hypothetical protein